MIPECMSEQCFDNTGVFNSLKMSLLLGRRTLGRRRSVLEGLQPRQPRTQPTILRQRVGEGI